MNRGGGDIGFRSQLTLTGQCAFPTLNRRGLRSSGWIVAKQEVIESMRAGLHNGVPEER
jgi:hypothetical protein